MDKNDFNEKSSNYVTASLAVLLMVAALAGGFGMYMAHSIQGIFSSASYHPGIATDYRAIPPQWIRYAETSVFDCDLVDPACFAASEDGTFFIGCDNPPRICVFSFSGEPIRSMELEAEPQCLAVGKPGTQWADQLIVGFSEHATGFTLDGKKKVVWKYPDKRGGVWSLALSDDSLYAADSIEKAVNRFGADGKLLDRFGSTSSEGGKSPAGPPVADSGQSGEEKSRFPGFVVLQSPMTLAVSPKTGLVYVANPGRHRVEAFTRDGHWESSFSWGGASGSVIGFCGDSNPVGLVLLDDGRLVTVEKSILRVKILRQDGQLDSVVAAPAVLELKPPNLERIQSLPNRTIQQNRDGLLSIAVVRTDHIAVFDPVWKIIRIFAPKTDRQAVRAEAEDIT